ncbi:MAG: Hpt domain-containing protein [Candidatus Brocadiae bacterium]|nr:Hpt domain-containing protein [Candidatus Brocadiia bacterium]
MGLDADDLQEIIADFIVESSDLLEKLDQDLVSLESNAQDKDLLNRIFRNFHTIKGTANFLNSESVFAQMGKLAHAAEDVMGEIRSGKKSLSSTITDAILASIDAIKKLFSQAEAGEKEAHDYSNIVANLRHFLEEEKQESIAPTKQEQKQESIAPTKQEQKQESIVEFKNSQSTEKIQEMPVSQEKQPEDEPKEGKEDGKKLVQSVSSPYLENSSLSQEDMEELIQDFLQESKELIEKADQDLVKLEKNPENQQLLDQIFRYLHTLKGTTSFLKFEKISELAHCAEEVMKEVRKGNLSLSSSVMDAILATVDFLKNFFQKLEKGNKDEGDPSQVIFNLKKSLNPNPQKYQSSLQILKEEKEQVPDTKVSAKKMQEKPSAMAEQSIRVETPRLDKMMNLVGELVLGRNRLSQVVRGLVEKLGDDRSCQELLSAVDFIDFVTSDLQRAVLKTRMQPVGKVFNRFNRTVRDLAKDLGKEVRLVIQGVETELDKSVIDEIGDPLVHLLRNSVDHGIEIPEERKKKGKNPTGTVVLCAAHEGNHIVITIQDDGKGIQPDAIKQKAIKQGLISQPEAERLPIKEILEFIFLPGFSTAEKVTNVSGRGVGLDVVKSCIQKLNGSVDISSELNKGTVFTIRLPLTLAIIHALHVQVAEEIFAIPITSVMQTARLSQHQIKSISGKEVMRFRDTIVPIVRLHHIFGLKSQKENHSENIYVVIAGMADKKIALVVDKIVGQEEVVVKPMGKVLENTTGFSGACIGGDGKVTLILDIMGILRLLPHSTGIILSSTEEKTSKPRKAEKEGPVCILLVEDSRSERKRTRLAIESRGGYKILEAMDGKEALSKLNDYPVDLVITDIEMPELNGYQLTAKIREQRKFHNLPVIAISSHKEMVDRIKGMEAGINTHLPKPFDEEELFIAIKNLLS